jgi:hypothetical protein
MNSNRIFKQLVIVSFLTIQILLNSCVRCTCIKNKNEFSSYEKEWLTENLFTDSIKFINDFNQSKYHYIYKVEDIVIPECSPGITKCCVCPEDHDLYGCYEELKVASHSYSLNYILKIDMSRLSGKPFTVNYSFLGQKFTSFENNLDTFVVKNIKYYNVNCYNFMGNPFNSYQLYYSKSKGVLQYIYNDTIWYRQP